MGNNYYLIKRIHFNDQVKALYHDLDLNLHLDQIAYHIGKSSGGYLTFDKHMFKIDSAIWKLVNNEEYAPNTSFIWTFINNKEYAIIGADFDERTFQEFTEMYIDKCTISESIDFC